MNRLSWPFGPLLNIIKHNFCHFVPKIAKSSKKKSISNRAKLIWFPISRVGWCQPYILKDVHPFRTIEIFFIFQQKNHCFSNFLDAVFKKFQVSSDWYYRKIFIFKATLADRRFFPLKSMCLDFRVIIFVVH
jgi:hypothetical protein